MLIFKVMVCFLAVFTSEDCVGGLPTIQDSPDNHQAGRSARSASNQGVTNEPGSRSRELLDYAERHEEEFHRKVNPDLKMIRINSGRILSSKIPAGKFDEEFSPRVLSAREKAPDHQLLKFLLDEERKNENIRRDGFRKGSSTPDQFLDKSKSRNGEATSSEFPTSSHGEKDTQRFSSVYAKVELDEKVNKNKEEFKNDLSTYLTDVLDAVVNAKVSTTTQKSHVEYEIDNSETEKKSQTLNVPNDPDKETASNLFSGQIHVPVPEEESRTFTIGMDDLPLENRQRKSVGDATTWHQQSTNMRPTRTQHLVQNKRSPGEGTHLKLPGYGGRRTVAKNPVRTVPRNRGQNRRHFTADSSSSLLGNHNQFSGLTPVQINAAMAYSNRQPSAQALNIDLSRALYQFGPSQLHALRGVFDKVPPSTQNFKPIAPKQVAYVPPRIIYDTKILPTSFMPFRTEQKTVEALSTLLGQNPAQQLQGFNLILRKDAPEKPEAKIVPTISTVEISRQGSIHDTVALSQAFVTPVPSIDINSGLADGSFRYSPDGGDLREGIGAPFDQRTPQYSVSDNLGHRENPYKTIPIVEEQGETLRGQEVTVKELHPVLGGAEILETTNGESESRYYPQHNEEEEHHGDAYAAKYSFGYHVKDYDSGNNFGHQETRDGVITEGRYHVLLPDGRLQNVKYHVDEGGYHAKVSYQSNHSA